MNNYYLFSSVINTNINDSYFPSSLNIYNEFEMYEFIYHGIRKSCKNKSHEELERFIYSVFLLVDSLRGRQYYNSFMVYYNFYMTITTVDYNMDRFDFKDDVIEFLKQHDFTAVYYNYAYMHGSNGNINSYLHYLALADTEYAVKNKRDNGEFIKQLIISKGLNLWNLIPNIECDYYKYKTNNSHYSQFEIVLSKFNIILKDKTFNKLICDFNYDLLLQFLHIMKNVYSIYNSFNFRENFNGIGGYKTIRTTRFIGELTWVYEIYLKDKLTNRYPNEDFSEPLDNTIKNFLRRIDNNYRKKYDDLQNKIYNKYKSRYSVNTDGLMYLLDVVTSSDMKKIDYFIHYLFIVKTFRNYYSHYMDRKTNLGTNYFKSSSLKLTIYNTLQITQYLFDNDFKFAVEINEGENLFAR